MTSLNNVMETLKEAKVNYYNTGVISITNEQYKEMMKQLIEAKEALEQVEETQAEEAQAEEAKREEIKKVFSELSQLQFEEQEGRPSSEYQSLDKEENQLNELAVKLLNEEDNAAANALLNEMKEVIKAATKLVMGDQTKKETRLIGMFNGAFVYEIEVDQTEGAKDKKVKATPKRLKPATIKNYSAKQLAKHLDRLQDHFVKAPYRVTFDYEQVRKYDKEEKGYYFYGISKESILRAVNDSYRLLGI